MIKRELAVIGVVWDGYLMVKDLSLDIVFDSLSPVKLFILLIQTHSFQNRRNENQS
jgi:hypothetical protein